MSYYATRARGWRNTERTMHRTKHCRLLAESDDVVRLSKPIKTGKKCRVCCMEEP